MSNTKFNLLLSYPYFNNEKNLEFMRRQDRSSFRLIVDSGAFTAWNTGKTILLDDYCRFLDSISDMRPFHAVQLDVIENPEASFKNLEIMRSRGFDVMPVFTRGESLDMLEKYYQMTDYIMFGGIAFGAKNKNYAKWFLHNNKGRKAHWLGFVNMPFIAKYRPESVDSSSWLTSARYGNLSLYMGAGQMTTVSRKHFVNKPDFKVLECFRRIGVGEEIYKNLSFKESWIGWIKPENVNLKIKQRGLGQYISTLSHLLRAYEVEKKYGTKIYLAGNNRDVNHVIFSAHKYLCDKGVIK